MRRLALAAALTALTALTACQPGTPPEAGSAPAAELSTPRQRASYMVGLDIARNLQPIKDEVDMAVVRRAIDDALAGRKPALDEAALARTREEFSAHLRAGREARQAAELADNRRKGEAFLTANARAPGVQTTPSGLQYKVLVAGKGPRPAADATVRVNYIGRTLDGREFENTYAVDHPAEVALGQVMPGWQEALPLMPVGSKYRFWLPASLSYGDRGVPGTIGPGATLVFDIELLAVAGSP
jgi:FKBP-type peptidyl-prolyl cis-trans isomerase